MRGPLIVHTPDVALSTARADQRPVIENLMQLYVHDFSALWGGEARGEVGEDGRFDPYPLEPYWRATDHTPLLVWTEGRLAGFALVNAQGHSGRPVDRNVVEFFILRKHRRAGVGATAARAVFHRHPGVWETAVMRRNLDALAFWRRAVAGCPGVSEIEEIDCRGPAWDGTVLRFRVAAAV